MKTEVSITLPDRVKPIYYSLEHRPNKDELIRIELSIEDFFVRVVDVVHEDKTKFLVLICEYSNAPAYKLYS